MSCLLYPFIQQSLICNGVFQSSAAHQYYVPKYSPCWTAALFWFSPLYAPDSACPLPHPLPHPHPSSVKACFFSVWCVLMLNIQPSPLCSVSPSCCRHTLTHISAVSLSLSLSLHLTHFSLFSQPLLSLSLLFITAVSPLLQQCYTVRTLMVSNEDESFKGDV